MSWTMTNSTDGKRAEIIGFGEKDELLPCPFCGGEAKVNTMRWRDGYEATVLCKNEPNAHYLNTWDEDEAKAIERITETWNRRAAMEFDNWFYLPKPKEPIVEVTETTHVWDGTKVKTDIFYQVQEQAVIAWAKELDEHIIKRICEVWNRQVERTCEYVVEDNMNESEGMGDVWFRCTSCDARFDYFADDWLMKQSYCPNCGARIVDKRELMGGDAR